MTTAIKVGVLSCAIAVGLFFAYWGFEIATKVLDDYKDNTDGAYLFIGGLLFSFAAGVVVMTLMTGLPQHMSRRELLLSLPLGVALLAGALAYLYYGPPSNLVPAHHRNVTPGALPTRTQGGPAPLATVTVGTPLPAR